MIARIDFETYSEAGYTFDPILNKWTGVGKKTGLAAVGVTAYAQHKSTEVLSLAYEIDGGLQLWIPTMPPPERLFMHVADGGLVEAHNCGFEFAIWEYVCFERMGWPRLSPGQMRDTAAAARAFGLPSSLGKIGEILQLPQQKEKDGSRLLKKFSIPRNPTKTDLRLRIRPEEDPIDAAKLYHYNMQDVIAQRSISENVPPLQSDELAFFINTQICNARGVSVRPDEVGACIRILEQAYAHYNKEFQQLTGISEASKVQQLLAYCNDMGAEFDVLDDDAITEALAGDLPDNVRRALGIRQTLGSAGVKKVYTMTNMMSRENRLTNLFIYHGARTGRDTGVDVQPQNLTKRGPDLRWCSTWNKPFGASIPVCPHCGEDAHALKQTSWSHEAVTYALSAMKEGDLFHVEQLFGDAVLTVSGCVRGLFVPRVGFEFICSDYSSIEAVVTAALAGEQWRLDSFARKADIYLVSAGRITGKTLDEYVEYQQHTGSKHPDRSNIGKPAELALGFGGWVNAWRQFDKSETFTDDDIKKNILAWRDASPAIVEMWGGQCRGVPWAPTKQEFFGLEGAAIQAVQNVGKVFKYRTISYIVENDVLFCELPSGRRLSYHKPRVETILKFEKPQFQLSYEGWNTNPNMGPIGWHRLKTYGGRLTENVVQAVARDIMAHAVNKLEAHGYPIVLRVHDELVAEVPRGTKGILEFESIMMDLPTWAHGWPIRASGGWRGVRYRKD